MRDSSYPPTDRWPVLLGVSLKLYLDIDESVAWAARIAAIARADAAITSGAVRVFVLPSLPALPGVIAALGDAPVAVGAQDLFWEDRGAYTGAVSGADLRWLGCRYVEIGHAERRRVFGEDDRVIGRKFAAAVRNGLTPVLCVGESQDRGADAAADVCVAQLESALSAAKGERVGELVVAYEPEWAIGRSEPAGAAHIGVVTRRLRAVLDARADVVSGAVLYGGSAGPGVLATLGEDVDGLFLGRFAHETASFAAVVAEAASRG